MTTRRRLGFRMRLTLIITGVFIAAGATLLAVQYLVVQQLFASALDVTGPIPSSSPARLATSLLLA